MKLRITFALAFLASVSWTSARAQTPPAPPAPPPAGQPAAPPAGKAQAWQKPCEADVNKHCQEAMKTGTVPECLAKHEKDLSEECTHAFLYRYQAMQLCKDDFEKLCKDKIGTPGLGMCIRENEKNLSDKCKTALAKGSKMAKAEKKAAAAEEKAEEKVAEKPAKPARKKKKAAAPATP